MLENKKIGELVGFETEVDFRGRCSFYHIVNRQIEAMVVMKEEISTILLFDVIDKFQYGLLTLTNGKTFMLIGFGDQPKAKPQDRDFFIRLIC